MKVRFDSNNSTLKLNFDELSDEKKCLFLSSSIVSTFENEKNRFCFWDEPDNHLSLTEVGQLIMSLRKMTNHSGQFIATSHHPETIRKFSDESTLVVHRNSHLEPTRISQLSDLRYTGDLIESLILDEVGA